MKKILVVAITLLVLAGCGSKGSQSKLSNGTDVLFTGPNNVSYTKQEMYDDLKAIDAEIITKFILTKIALNNETINSDELYAEVDELIEAYKSMGYENYIISQYGSMEAFREDYYSELLVAELSKVYVVENYDKLLADDSPVKMQMATFTDLADAEKCIADVNNGSTFDMAAVNNNSSNAPQSTVYTDSDSSLAFEVKEYLNSTDTTGLSTIITSTTSTTGADGTAVENNTYYVLNIESRNAEDFKDDYINVLASSQSTEDIKKYFLETHEISFYDQDIYKLMSETYEVLK